MAEVDPLGVLATTRAVVEAARAVTIDQERVATVAAELAANPAPAPTWEGNLHYRDGTWRTVAWVLALDALNFCFWGQGDDPEERWRVEYRDALHDGYWALAAALRRAVDEGYPIWDPGYLATISESDLTAILRPATAPKTTQVPLFAERLANLRELGRGLTETAAGREGGGTEERREVGEAGMREEEIGERAVMGLLGEAAGSAARLVELVVRRFPSFDDVARYDGREVRFYKRAQILVADLHGALFESRSRGGEKARSTNLTPRLTPFVDLDVLTAFADYKVPQVLRRFGILRYGEELAGRIARRELLAAGSAEEVEIRAATVRGCELLRKALAARGVHLRAFEVDWALWNLGQSLPPGTEPYHRTRTIFY